MNKLRQIRISELRKEIHPMEAYIINLLDGIKVELLEEDGVKYHHYYKNNNPDIDEDIDEDDIDYDFYMTHVLDSDEMLIDESNFFLDFFKKFNIDFNDEYEEMQVLIVLKYLLEKHLKINIDEIIPGMV